MSRYRIEYEFNINAGDPKIATLEDDIRFIAEDSKIAIDDAIKDIGCDAKFVGFRIVKLD